MSNALPVESPPPTLQPLAELPALIVADARRDVRGWEIRTEEGHVLGVVSDLLSDPDRLLAAILIVSSPEAGGSDSYVPLSAVSARAGHLVLGGSLRPIKLRYRSTVRLTARVAAAATLLLIVVWAFRAVAC